MGGDMAVQVVQVLCGLALFLYGMKIMADGLEASAGSKLKQFLDLITRNRLVGVMIGAFITMIIQSSSATTVMVVGFVNAGLLELTQAVGVIMGANIGTTITGVIVALKINDIAPVAVTIGVFLILFTKRKFLKHIGQVIAGLGILFLGMTSMGDALQPLSESEVFKNLFESTQNPLIGMAVGLLVTGIIQSSSAVIGVIIVLASLGTLNLHSAIFILYGMNIGTCVTALIASAGANKTAKKAALIHLMFNIIGSVIFMIITLLPIGYISFIENMFKGDPGKQLAFAHVIFNIVTTVLLFPTGDLLVKIVNKFIPGDETENKEKRLMYLDHRILNSPHIAAEQVHREVERMADLSLRNYKLAVDTFLNRNKKNIDAIKENEETINFLNHEITRYLVKISVLELGEGDNKMIGSLYHVLNDIERVGDHAENIMEFSTAFIENKKMFSKAALKEMSQMAADVENVLSDSIEVFIKREFNKAKIDSILEMEENVDEQMNSYKENHIKRLKKGDCTPASGMLFINMLSDLERVSDHATNIALSLRYQISNGS